MRGMRAVVGSLLVLAATHVSVEILWRGDFEAGNTKQWPGAPKPDIVTVVNRDATASGCRGNGVPGSAG